MVYHQGETVLASYLWTYSSDQGSVVSGQEDSSFSWTPNGGLPVIGTVDSGEGMLPVYDTSGVVEALLSGDYSSSTASQLASCTTLDGTATYTYDATGQLTGVTYSSSSPQSPTPNPESYTYDANGNRTSVAGTGPVPTAYVIGPDNQLLSDGTYRYTYDADGNRTSRFVWTDADADGQIDDAEQSQITQYTWDNRNRLVQVTDRATLAGPATQIVTNYYDAENRWVGRAVDPDGDTGTAAIHLTTFAYAGHQIIFQFDGTAETFPAPLGAEGEGLSSSPLPLAGEGSGGEGGSTQTGFTTPLTVENLSHHYLWADAVDQLLADEQLQATASGYDLTTPGTVVLPLTDQLGTVRDLAVCENGVTSVANHRVYDSYGNLQSETNAAVDCVFGFTGRPWDEATGLQNNLNRWYDPTVGRWASEDLIGFEGQQANTSVYCGNDPVNRSDPSGLWPITQHYGLDNHESIAAQAAKRAGYKCTTDAEKAFFEGLMTGAESVDAPEGMGPLVDLETPGFGVKHVKEMHPKTFQTQCGCNVHQHAMVPHNDDGSPMFAEPQARRMQDRIVNWILECYEAAQREQKRRQNENRTVPPDFRTKDTSINGQIGMQLGKAVHTIADLYCPSHVVRANKKVNGPITMFQDYSKQDPAKHHNGDLRNYNATTAACFNEAIRMSAQFLTMFKNGATPEAVKAWLIGPGGPVEITSKTVVGGTASEYAPDQTEK